MRPVNVKLKFFFYLLMRDDLDLTDRDIDSLVEATNELYKDNATLVFSDLALEKKALLLASNF